MYHWLSKYLHYDSILCVEFYFHYCSNILLIFFLTLFLSEDARYTLNLKTNHMQNPKAFVNLKLASTQNVLCASILHKICAYLIRTIVVKVVYKNKSN